MDPQMQLVHALQLCVMAAAIAATSAEPSARTGTPTTRAPAIAALRAYPGKDGTGTTISASGSRASLPALTINSSEPLPNTMRPASTPVSAAMALVKSHQLGSG